MRLTISTTLFAFCSLLPAQDGRLTAVHGVPGLSAPVEVFANGNRLFAFEYGEQRGPLSLTPGTYAVDIRLAGSSILSGSAQITAGGDFTAVAHLDAMGAPQLSFFANDTSVLTLPQSRIVARHLAQAPAVDVILTQNGIPVGTLANLANGGEAGVHVGPGVYGVQLNVAGTTNTAFGPVDVALENGYSYVAHAVGDVSQPNFTLVVQRIDLASRVTVLHGIANLPAPVAVAANGSQLFQFAFNDNRGPLVLDPGSYSLDVSLNGASVLNTSAAVGQGDDVTVAAYQDTGGANQLGIFANDMTPLDGPRVRVTVRHLANAPAVDVAVDNQGTRLATLSGLSNGQEVVAELPAGLFEVSLFAAGMNQRVFGPVTWKAIVGQHTFFSAIGDFQAGSFTINALERDTAPAVPGTIATRIGGSACAGGIGVSSPSFEYGEPFAVTLSGGGAGAMGLLYYGDSLSSINGMPLPLDGSLFGAPGCFLHTNILATHPLVLDGSGAVSVSLVVPRALFGSLQPGYFQYLWMTNANALGFVSSDYLEIR